MIFEFEPTGNTACLLSESSGSVQFNSKFWKQFSSRWGYGYLMEYRVELKTVTSPEEVRLEDDPVRRGVDYHFRMTNGRRIFTIPDKRSYALQIHFSYPQL